MGIPSDSWDVMKVSFFTSCSSNLLAFKYCLAFPPCPFSLVFVMYNSSFIDMVNSILQSSKSLSYFILSYIQIDIIPFTIKSSQQCGKKQVISQTSEEVRGNLTAPLVLSGSCYLSLLSLTLAMTWMIGYFLS